MAKTKTTEKKCCHKSFLTRQMLGMIPGDGSSPVTNYQLRADGGIQLRADGSKQLRA